MSTTKKQGRVATGGPLPSVGETPLKRFQMIDLPLGYPADASCAENLNPTHLGGRSFSFASQASSSLSKCVCA
jgi:hypothetical protein